MLIKNSDNQFGLIAILLHWVMAILLIGLLALGLYMIDLPISLLKLKLYGWHKEYGLLALLLVIIRFSWRLANKLPKLPDSIPHWQQLAALSVHFAFYFFMFAMPLTGWLLTSATGLPVSFFGLIVLPDLVSADVTLRDNLILVHRWLGYGLIAAILMHIGATIQHYVVHKDNILRRMWL